MTGEPAPPSCNTGAECTTAAAAKIDYLSFTLPLGVPVEDMLPGYESLDWQELPRGGYGYSRCRVAGHIRIYSEGTAEMGTHVQMSGQGCDEYAGYISGDWRGFFQYLGQIGARATRIDVAFDDFSGTVTVGRVLESLREGWVTTQYRDWHSERSGKIGERGSTGATVYLGTPTSDTRLVIYDKRAEQRAKGSQAGIRSLMVLSPKLGGQVLDASGVDPRAGDGPWTRVEFRCRDERARSLMTSIAESADELAAVRTVLGYVRHYVDFKCPSETDSNKRRWKTADWWLSFLHGAEKCRLTIQAVVRSIEAVKRWLRMQVAPCLATVTEAEGGAVDWFYELVQEGRTRMRRRHWALVGSS